MIRAFSAAKRARCTVAMLAAVALSLPACTTQSSRIGADDGSDVCRPHRVALDSTGDYFGEDMVKGALIGAAGGALLGALTGGGHNVGERALIGAVAGAAIGTAAGYWSAKRQQEHDQAQLYRTVASDINNENAQIDKTQLAFNQLIDCRRNEAAQIRADLAAGRIDRTEADRRMAGVRLRYAKDIEIARAISGKVQERGANFQFANEQINPQPYRAVAQAPVRAQPNASAGTMGSLRSGQIYYAAREDDNWMRVTMPGEQTGYAPVAAMVAAPPAQTVASSSQTSSSRGSRAASSRQRTQTAAAPARAPRDPEVAQAASTNLAKRDQLAQSIEVAASNAGSAFELAPTS